MKKTLMSILLAASFAAPLAANAQFAVSINVAPPALPVYVQPPIPGDGYMWTPGYCAWDPDVSDYYWVPGTWVQAPFVGALWTPGYWGWAGGSYGWHNGYWGDHIGFYGGVNYGFGYIGVGYVGGHWDHGAFAYNGAVNNVTNVHITNVYRDTSVIHETNVNRVSFNGGSGGIQVHASAQEEAFARASHPALPAAQVQHQQEAMHNPELRNSVNHGNPAVAATSAPGKFSGPNVVPAKGAPAGGGHPEPQAQQHQETQAQAHPQAQPQQHPQPQAHPQPQPQVHPQPQPQQHQEQQQFHPQPQPQPQAQQPHPQPQEAHPAPQQHAAPQPHGGQEHHEDDKHEH